MIALNGIDLLSLQSGLKIGHDNKGNANVFDPLRKGYFPITPEEMVRQLWILYFLDVMLISKKLMAVERAFQHSGFTRRFDLVIFGRTTTPALLCEFKAPSVRITQSTFDQIARYNMQLHVPFSLISNGTSHYCFQIDDENRRFVWMDHIPLRPPAPKGDA
jgi:hypothetical protein